GNGDRRLFLRQYPIVSVQSVRYRPVTVLKIINNDVATNQQARVTVTINGLTLYRNASGVASINTTITYAGNATLTALANAVNALGNGWAAQVVGDANDYGKWPSIDLYVSNSSGADGQGALTARGAFAELKMHTYELQGYAFSAR